MAPARCRALARRLFPAVPLGLLPALLAAPAWAGSGLDPLPPPGASPNGQRIFDLYTYQITPFALLIFFLVEGLLLAIIIKFRRSRQPAGYEPPQWHGNRWLEIAWTVGPTLILIFIGTVSFLELQRDFQKPSDAVTNLDVTITAHQYGWTYTYPQGFQVHSEGFNVEPMVVPVGKLTRLRLQSTDVIHSFWVPDLTGKTDAVPGYDNFTWIKPTQVGQWRGECAELCGSGHDTMQIRVQAMSDADFDAWVAGQELKAKPPAAGSSPGPAAGTSPAPAASAAPAPSPGSGAAPGPTPSYGT